MHMYLNYKTSLPTGSDLVEKDDSKAPEQSGVPTPAGESSTQRHPTPDSRRQRRGAQDFTRLPPERAQRHSKTNPWRKAKTASPQEIDKKNLPKKRKS